MALAGIFLVTSVVPLAGCGPKAGADGGGKGGKNGGGAGGPGPHRDAEPAWF